MKQKTRCAARAERPACAAQLHLRGLRRPLGDEALAGGAILVLLLEMSLAAMWYGDRLMMRMDSANLNRQLKEYQTRSERTAP